jgi:hypothetical protein
MFLHQIPKAEMHSDEERFSAMENVHVKWG